MICNILEQCVEGELSAKKVPKCTNKSAKCIESSDDR